MKLSVPFLMNKEEYLSAAAEYNILYDEKSTPKKLQVFAQTYPEKRINIFFKGIKEEEIVHIITQAAIENFAIVTEYFLSDDIIELFKSRKWDYYVLLPASNFYQLEYYLLKGVSDIFIADDLWHNLPRVRQKCSEIKIRMVADEIPVVEKKYGIDSLAYYTAFIPRPEDYELLDKYIDILQFNTYDNDKLKFLYKIWFIKHKWTGNTNQIVSSLGVAGLYNKNIVSNYTESKIQCGCRCLYDERCKCRKCKTIYTFSKTLFDKGLELKQ